MAVRRSNDDQRDLRVRVKELELRVLWLERRLKKIAAAAKVNDAPRGKKSTRPRCPGCYADIPKGQREKTCLYCGFSFEAVKPLKPRR